MSTPRLTASIGLDTETPKDFYKLDSKGRPIAVAYFAARWDGNVIAGIHLILRDDTEQKYGNFDAGDKTLGSYTFDEGETLAKGWLRDSGFGYRSLRQIQFDTSKSPAGQPALLAGPSGYDNEVYLDVENSTLVGVRAWVNPDNFMQGLAFYVNP